MSEQGSQPQASFQVVPASAAMLWRKWAARWDHFQESYVPEREIQFSLMIDYVLGPWRHASLRILDLACGPGSISQRLLRREPGAEVVCLDLDPWLLEMGRRTLVDAERIIWVEADLRSPGWVAQLPHRAFDAVLSATALHWLDDPLRERVFGEIANILTDGGLFLNADIIPTGTPKAQLYAREMLLRWQAAQISRSEGEAWRTFWEEAQRDPAFRELMEERKRKLGPRPPRVFSSLPAYETALLNAGFRECAEVWRYHQNAILLAFR